jgi:FKBP-type peptidyl-prolyl cis-trans isomerase
MVCCSRALVVATAILLTVLHPENNNYVVNSLSMPFSTSSFGASASASRRDALTHTAKIAVGAAASSMLVLDTAVTHAAEAYQDGPEGLRYFVTQEGSGPKPERGQKIETSYTLWINGFPDEEGGSSKAKQIDSSKKLFGDTPFKVRAGVSQVIRGWDLALIDMKEGESRKLIVPSELGYGDKGVGPIPGKATLYFEMTLTKVGPVEELTPDAKKWLEEHPL